ncbi:Stress-activated map kinase interacting 1 family-containing protein [Strongyloides ratti]|uniref:Stress-activated map kinase interacting 1 family-containing protein n=1 Tax=Strongyloides ratti TaxID=34506 RepID=A0A090LDE5_STRRB|nr:Stress-activated map kinase interacting 1 family-containing protein [Strongyloides ratti]CEF67806.1 Stress-activated map kinase interacting 1 family-containing protein [Strongyloides ratti]
MALNDIEEINNFMSYAINFDGKQKVWASQIFKEKSIRKTISFNNDTTQSDTTSDEENNLSEENIFSLFENKLEDKLTSSTFYKEKIEKINKKTMFEESMKNKEISKIPKKKTYISYISMYLENAKIAPFKEYLNPFESYYKYINTGPNHVSVNIILPFVETGKNSIIIECSKDIEISNLIGLICYKYTLKNYKPPLKDIYYYELKIAHSSHEIYYDLPSLDVTKKFNEANFDNLALIDITLLGNNYSKNVTVYTYDAKPYIISLPSYNVPLSMVRDKCLDMVRSKLGLEKKIKDLKMPLFEANCDEFVLLRQNSVRGDFTSIYEKKTVTSSRNITTSNDKSPNTIDNMLPVISENIDYQEPEICSPSDNTLNDSKCITTFEVERLTNLKLKRTELLEITETHIQFISQRTPKVLLVIPWQLLAHFYLSKNHNGVALYKIIWIKFDYLFHNGMKKSNSNTLDSKNFFQRIYKKRGSQSLSSSTNDFQGRNSIDKCSFQYDYKFFEENISFAKWKIINFELSSYYSSSITNIMYPIENNLSALVYKKSDNGRRSPLEAWDIYKKNQNSSHLINNL